MKTRTIVLLMLAMLPCPAFAAGILDGHLHTVVTLISVFNIVLVVTSFISIVQLLAHRDHNRTPFHVFNLIAILLFYSLSIPFLLHHKEFFEGFEHLSDKECIKKYFFNNDVISWIKKIIIVGFVVNIIYIVRYARTYYLE